MNRVLAVVAAATLTLFATNAFAQCDSCDDGCAACSTHTGSRTPRCCGAGKCQAAGKCCGGPQCVGKAEMVDVDKDCWKVECKEICIPAVRFPWEHGGSKLNLFSFLHSKKGCGKKSCCDSGCDGGCDSACGCVGGCASCVPPKCGSVRTIRVLKKDTYTEKACKYSMELVEQEKSNANCDGRNCDTGCSEGCGAHAAATATTNANDPVVAQPIYEQPMYAQPLEIQPMQSQSYHTLPVESIHLRPQQSPVPIPLDTHMPAAPSIDPTTKSSVSPNLKMAGQKLRSQSVFSSLTGRQRSN